MSCVVQVVVVSHSYSRFKGESFLVGFTMCLVVAMRPAARARSIWRVSVKESVSAAPSAATWKVGG